MKLAMVFPGQGSQSVGMLRGYEDVPEALEVLLEAQQVLGGELIRLLEEGPAEALNLTVNTQPAMLTAGYAAYRAWLARGGPRPELLAGHSLGEYTAAVAAGALSFEDGMRLVSLRGRLMAEAQSEVPGTMAAIIGLSADQVADACEGASAAGHVSPANFNTPSQIVVSGEEAGVVRAMELAEQAGAEKVVRLQVGAAFHSKLMEPTQQKMGEELATATWEDPDVPLASNAFGKLVDSADEIRNALFTQIASPVRWVDCVRSLEQAGVTTFVELGPGRVLSGLVRQILGMEADASSADSRKKLEALVSSRPELVQQ